jgi:uncharacterized damage-inducible protein DinB
MTNTTYQSLLDALLDSWERNNIIVINLLRALPPDALRIRPAPGSPSIAQIFTHIHYVRSVLVLEDAPESATKLPDEEWVAESNTDRVVRLLTQSAKAVGDAVKGRLHSGREMNLHYDHPILMLQHLIWHEGYHHGQIKIALKTASRPLNDEEIGPLTWDVWTKKTK